MMSLKKQLEDQHAEVKFLKYRHQVAKAADRGGNSLSN